MKPSCSSSRSILFAAALAAAALALFAATAAAKPLAEFKVGLKATSKMIWSEDITSSCQGTGQLRTISNGETIVTVRSKKQPIVALEHVRGSDPILIFTGKTTGLPVAGTLARKVKEEGFTVVAAKPGACGTPEPAPHDCGTRAYPPDSQINLYYTTPGNWPFDTTPPLHDVLTISGPNSAQWTAGPPFLNCKSPARGDLLSGQAGTEETPPLTFPVSIPALLARKHFTLKAHDTLRFDALPKSLQGPGMSGTRPVKIETSVSLSFTRVGR